MPEVVPSASLVEQSTQGQRQMVVAAGGLGLLAVVLSAIGVYGVVAFAVASRTREIGLRMALGASRERVIAAVLEDALRLALPGMAGGGVLAAGVGAAARSMLLGVSPVDPVSVGAAGGVLLLVVILACLAPALKASGVRPVVALRHE
jgi:ABC-type antimicrobial peptide transport system permease subunit